MVAIPTTKIRVGGRSVTGYGIPLGGKHAKLLHITTAWVSKVDHKWASQYAWHVTPDSKYARRKLSAVEVRSGTWGKKGHSYMHEEIMRHRMKTKIPKGYKVDHMHTGTTNYNMRGALRVVSPSENAHNRKKFSAHASSQYKGVQKIGTKWKASISVSKVKYGLGTYKIEKHAALAFDFGALTLAPKSSLNIAKSVRGVPKAIQTSVLKALMRGNAVRSKRMTGLSAAKGGGLNIIVKTHIEKRKGKAVTVRRHTRKTAKRK